MSAWDITAILSGILFFGMVIKLGFDLRKEKGKNNEQ